MEVDWSSTGQQTTDMVKSYVDTTLFNKAAPVRKKLQLDQHHAQPPHHDVVSSGLETEQRTHVTANIRSVNNGVEACLNHQQYLLGKLTANKRSGYSVYVESIHDA